MYRFITKISALSAVFFMNIAVSAEKTFIWPNFEDGKSAIYYAEFENGQWGETELVVDNGMRNDSPVIATDDQGNQLVVWTFSDESSNTIAFRYRQAGGSWSNVTRLNTSIKNNLAPTLQVDTEGRFWMFWVASDQINKDNVYAAYYKDGWKNLTNISNNNDGHDVDPVAMINGNNQLQVSWHFLDKEFALQNKIKALINNEWVTVASTNAPSSNNGESYEAGMNLPASYNENTAGYGNLTDANGVSTKIIPNF